jgi:hypothetical protein
MSQRLHTYLGHYGFHPPRDFRVAIPFLLGFLGAGAAVVFAGLMAALGRLHLDSQRFIFLAAVCLAFLVAALASRYSRRFSWIVIAIAALELTLGSGTEALSRVGVGTSLLPPDVNLAKSVKFRHHSLLQVAPIPGFVSPNGRVVRHNSLGLRGPEPELTRDGTPKILINVYGGSTTYDSFVPEGSTWTELLERELGAAYEVLNYGSPGYTTVEHVIQTAFYPDKSGRNPDCALDYVGWNDIRSAHVPDLDSGYATFHLPDQMHKFLTRQGWEYSPLTRLFIPALKGLLDRTTVAPQVTLPPRTGSDPRLESIFLANISTLAALNDGRGTTSVFIAQMLNRAQLVADATYGWFPRVKDKDVWPLQARFNLILGERASSLGKPFIDAGIDQFVNSDFADNGHFNEAGSVKFAKTIAARVAQACPQPAVPEPKQ